MSGESMQRARVDGAELEFEVTGAGEPVLLIHGALIAEAVSFRQGCADPDRPGQEGRSDPTAVCRG